MKRSRGASGQTIAACLIVRNGAQTIERCIASVRSHVDEVCVYLAGRSTDGSAQLLKRLALQPGAAIRIERGGWNEDYAEARNASFAMASSEYLLWLDDDEVVERGSELRASLKDRPDALYVRRVEMDGRHPTTCFHMRIVAAKLGAQWVSPIHEHLDPAVLATASRRIVDPRGLRVVHHPVRVSGRHRHRRLIGKVFAETGDPRLGVFLAFHLAKDDLDDEAAAVVLVRALAGGRLPLHLLRDAYFLLAHCRYRLGDMDGFLVATAMFERVDDEYRQDPLLSRMAALEHAFPLADDDPVWKAYPADFAWGDSDHR